jgi:ABC-type transport system involved in multi-copper enzyme maturation permease subunit
MMTQTLAILLDAFRELQSKKMFWAVLILNVLVVAGFGVIGANDHTLTVLWFEPLGDMRSAPVPPIFLYKILFSTFVVGWWLTWLAALLALISTAGIFPDFMASGSVDLFLARPIGRLRLFFTKYLAGLLFVTLQVTLFTSLSFLVLGWRASLWEPGLFAAIPLVVVFFSYLFAICALLGSLTRSTIAALLLTILAWLAIWAVDLGDRATTTLRHSAELQQAYLDDQIEELNTQIANVRAAPDQTGLAALQTRHDALIEDRKKAETPSALVTAQNVAFAVKSVVPKTRETINLLDRVLFKDKDLQEASKHADSVATTAPEFPRRRGGPRFEARQMEQLKAGRERPIWWIIGTSLLFEAVCFALAAWHFCTRDF